MFKFSVTVVDEELHVVCNIKKNVLMSGIKMDFIHLCRLLVFILLVH